MLLTPDFSPVYFERKVLGTRLADDYLAKPGLFKSTG
jgi:hypothetical protein